MSSSAGPSPPAPSASGRSVVFLSEEERERLAASHPGVTVMRYTHDRFEPWPIEQVRSCVEDLVRISSRCADAASAEREARADPRLSRFGNAYRTIFSKLVAPEFARDERAVRSVLALLAMKDDLEKGVVTQAFADSKAGEVALREAMRDAA